MQLCLELALSLPIAALLQLCVETDDSEGQHVDKLKELAGTDEESSRVIDFRSRDPGAEQAARLADKVMISTERLDCVRLSC